MEHYLPAVFPASPRPPRDYTWMVRFAPLLIIPLWVAILVSSIFFSPTTPAHYQPLSPIPIAVGVFVLAWPFLALGALCWVIGIFLLAKPLALRTQIQRAGKSAIELGAENLWVGHLWIHFFWVLEGAFLAFVLTRQLSVLMFVLMLGWCIVGLEALIAWWTIPRLLRALSSFPIDAVDSVDSVDS